MTEQQAIKILINIGVPKTKAEKLNDIIGLNMVESQFLKEFEDKSEGACMTLINNSLEKNKKSYENKIIKVLGSNDQLLVSNVWELVRTEINKAFAKNDKLKNGIYFKL